MMVLVVLVPLGLAINAVAVARTEHAAEAFGGGQVLDLPGVDLNVRDYGGPGERAVVLLHGYASSIEWWQPVAEKLAAEGHRVIAIDLIGHGGSAAPRDGADYGAQGQATAVRQALSALGVSRAVLIRHSMGGAVATAVAESEPELVEKVVVSDTPAEAGLVAVPFMSRVVCAPVVGPAVDRFRGIRAVTDSSLQTGFAADYPVPEFAYRSLRRLTHVGVCDSDAVEDLNSGVPIADRLAGLGRPVLVVWGEDDVLTPTQPNVARFTEAGLPPTVIAGSGHSPMVEKPDEFVSAITEFVSVS